MDAHYNVSKLIRLNTNNNMSYSKVYINPNFNKNLYTNTLPERNATYVNPTFSNAIRTGDYKQTNISTKIYVNPNFIKTTKPEMSVSETSMKRKELVNNISSYGNLINDPEQSSNTDNRLLTTVKNKSRYSLVRFNNNTKCPNVTVTKKPTNTVKISKYKLVPLNNMKDIIANTKCSGNSTIKNFNTSPQIKKQNIVRPNVINMSRSRHKFIKHKPSSSPRLVSSLCIDNVVSKEESKKNHTTMKIKIRKVMKKNNIPCPLFKKFGKCMRLVHGRCDFLHDKKHVSICRKFLKGVCHDKDCLLSHDLTVKKMPTCYFYLRGMCNKTDCPYLHIKLSEKSKVCPEFLKGYCEKGKKCLNRHVNITFNTSAKTVYTHKVIINNNKKNNTESVNRKCKRNSVKYDINKRNSEEMKQIVETKGHSITEHRYYQDLDNEASNDKAICEVIKPSRCKLGTLPSFIQL